MRHTDNLGNDSVIIKGGSQIFCAGRGISHSEMPEAEGVTCGIQLWITLAKKSKKIDESKEIPKDLISELLNENFFRLLLPKSYGGLEMDFIDYLKIIFEIASYDASVAWCINQSNVLATNAAFMDSKLAKKHAI